MAVSESLYAERVKVHPQRITGRFRTIKWAVLIVLLAIYYLVPWLRWDRGPNAPDQAILVDMAGRRAYFFWIEIWPQEVYYLAGLLILGAVGLFLVTSVAGRVWCGFTCPQTVWTDLYMQVERWIEGDRNRRIKLDEEPWSVRKLGLRIAKHGVWLLIALATGGAWIMYFNDAPTVVREIFTGQASTAVYGFTALFTATTYVLAGWAREQVCIYMCPWPRFQSAMFDEHTLLVTYADWRGEKRGHAKRGTDFSNRGHCIDCELCVRVCPTGIDIREGQQMACIGCGLCVDACNSIMDKMDLPRDLISYDSLADQAALARKEKPPALRIIRPRTIIYATLLLLAAAGMLVEPAAALAPRRHGAGRPRAFVRHAGERRHPERLCDEDLEQVPRARAVRRACHRHRGPRLQDRRARKRAGGREGRFGRNIPHAAAHAARRPHAQVDSDRDHSGGYQQQGREQP